MATLSTSHREAGKELQTELGEFERRAAEAVETLWQYSLEDERKKHDQLATLEADILNGTLISAGPTVLAMAVRAVDRRPARGKLVIAENKWRVTLLGS